MPVVEQGGKQRRLHGHAAAPLRESQGGVLVANQLRQQPVRFYESISCGNISDAQPNGEAVDEDAKNPIRAGASLHTAE